MERRLCQLWVVYDRPRDFPRHVVVREHWVLVRPRGTEAAPVACLYDTLDEARDDCESKGLVFVGREPLDEPQIVGVFM